MWARRALVVWGIGGVLAILIEAATRLAFHVYGAIGAGLRVEHWCIMGAWVAFMLWAEGWRGFHERFNPRVVRRAFDLAEKGSTSNRVFAPLWAMSFWGDARRQVVVIWTLTAVIVGLVFAIRAMPQPWRGVIDAGVVAGLSFGAASLLWHTKREAGRRAEARRAARASGAPSPSR